MAVEGLLSFFPQLRNEVDVHYIGAPCPRAAIVALIGADNQSAPVLVLGHGRVVSDAGVETRTHNGVRFIDAPDQIRRYLCGAVRRGARRLKGRPAAGLGDKLRRPCQRPCLFRP